MQTHTAPSLDTLKASLETLIAADAAFYEAATAHGLAPETRSTLAALRTAEDFLQQAAMALATGSLLTSHEVLTPFRWAVMKAVEVNFALPEKVRGDLSFDCFRAKTRRH